MEVILTVNLTDGRAAAVAAWKQRAAFIPGSVVEAFVGSSLVLELPVYLCQFFAVVPDDLRGTLWLSFRLHYSQPRETQIEHHVRTALPCGLEDTFF